MKKLKLLSIAVGAIATFTIAATPKAALGQTPLQAQPNPGMSLTREQQIQFQQLQENAIAQIDAVLTPEQRTHIKSGYLATLYDEQKSCRDVPWHVSTLCAFKRI